MRPALLSVFVVLLCACTSAAGSGTLQVTACGELAATEGYPTSAGLGFVDGWSLTIDRVIVSLDLFAISHQGVAVPLEADHVLVNLHGGEQTVWRFPAIPAQRYEQVGYRIIPAATGARHIGVVTAADEARMVTDHLAVLFQGTARHATHGDYMFDMGLPIEIHLSSCINGVDMSDGLVVTPNGMTHAQMTFHLDHFFLDGLLDPNAAIHFEAYAATGGTARHVTYEGLEMQHLADLRDIDGSPLLDASGQLLFYDPGSVALPTGSLRNFVFHQASTIGHLNGEGHCGYYVVNGL